MAVSNYEAVKALHEFRETARATEEEHIARVPDGEREEIRQIFARGTVAKITDVTTGISWYEKRTGGTNHADVQPLTAADTGIAIGAGADVAIDAADGTILDMIIDTGMAGNG